MLENIDRTYGLVFSQPVLLALVSSGLSRDNAYRIVQRCARQAWERKTHFSKVLLDDPEVKLTQDQIAKAMELKSALSNVSNTFEVLLREIALPKSKTDQYRKLLVGSRVE